MTLFRVLSRQEKDLLGFLLQSNTSALPLINSLDGLVVNEMRDGQMGSLLLIPKGLESASRSFGQQLVLAEFTDQDDVPVSVAVNLDKEGELFELDIWKADFTPLIAWPDPSAVRIQDGNRSVQ